MAGKTSLSALNLDSDRPFEYLVPVVESLLRDGNSLAYPNSDRGFIGTQGGWVCYLKQPINFSLIAERFELPPTVQLSSDNDTIFDERTWITIEGSTAK